MQRAGQAAFDALCERWPEARRIAVLCGGGNNGGDGYVVAALAHRAGLQPEIFYTRAPDTLSGDALTMAQRCQGLAIPQQPLPEDALPVEADVLVDGLLGTGLSGALRDDMAHCWPGWMPCRCPVWRWIFPPASMPTPACRWARYCGRI